MDENGMKVRPLTVEKKQTHFTLTGHCSCTVLLFEILWNRVAGTFWLLVEQLNEISFCQCRTPLLWLSREMEEMCKKWVVANSTPHSKRGWGCSWWPLSSSLTLNATERPCFQKETLTTIIIITNVTGVRYLFATSCNITFWAHISCLQWNLTQS